MTSSIRRRGSIGPGRAVFLAGNVMVLGALVLVILVPVWMVVVTSLASDREVVGTGYVLIPRTIYLEYYLSIVRGGYLSAFVRSIAITVIGTAVSMAVCIPASYALAQPDLLGRSLVLKLIILTMLFEGGIIPFYMVVRHLGLLDSYAALIVPVAISTYELILLKNYMASVPTSLLDSGRIDGCNELQILVSIVVPVSVPIIAAISLFYSVHYWNRYLEVVMFINSSAKYTLQVLLRQLIFESESITTGTEHVYNNFKMAVMVMAMVPIVLVYPWIQRHFVSGLMLGSIKG